MMNQGPITPEAFIAQIASTVIGGVKKVMQEQPAKTYEVYRQTNTGPVTQSVSLPQMLAELTDQVKVSCELTRCQIAMDQQVIHATEALRAEIEENRKLASRITKKNRRKADDDEDE